MALIDCPDDQAASSAAMRLETAILDFAPAGARLVSLSVQYSGNTDMTPGAAVSVRLTRATRTMQFVDADLMTGAGHMMASGSAVLALIPSA